MSVYYAHVSADRRQKAHVFRVENESAENAEAVSGTGGATSISIFCTCCLQWTLEIACFERVFFSSPDHSISHVPEDSHSF